MTNQQTPPDQPADNTNQSSGMQTSLDPGVSMSADSSMTFEKNASMLLSELLFDDEHNTSIAADLPGNAFPVGAERPPASVASNNNEAPASTIDAGIKPRRTAPVVQLSIVSETGSEELPMPASEHSVAQVPEEPKWAHEKEPMVGVSKNSTVASSLALQPTMSLSTGGSDAGSEAAVLDPPKRRRRIWLYMGISALLATFAAIGLFGSSAGREWVQSLGVVNVVTPDNEVPLHQPSLAPSGSPSCAPSDPPTTSPSASPSSAPSNAPSDAPSASPTTGPSTSPTASPSSSPTDRPSSSPTISTAPSAAPTGVPSVSPTISPAPSACPSAAPSKAPTITPMPTLTPPLFQPGNLTTLEHGLLLSAGLRARIIAHTGDPVAYVNGNFSEAIFHGNPDFGATFPDTRPNNLGGWVYASNSEMPEEGTGGVGAITFDKDGNIVDYKMVLEGTTMNCGGGRTPWNTWVSCEEIEFTGNIYQVDPFGKRKSQKMTLGSAGGRWESFAYDIRDKAKPRFFATEDHNKGTVRRFTPMNVSWDEPWEMLHSEGPTEYLIVHPNENQTGGTFEWITDIEVARFNARAYYPQSEGIDVYGSDMYVVCKKIKQMFAFDLDTMEYYNQSTENGLFDGGPDQLQRILGHSGDLLFFTEEGGADAGIHARDEKGRFYTILESPTYHDETSGLAFSPDGHHLLVAYQVNGLLFDVWREDGLPFQARTLNVKYHQRGRG